MTASDLRQRAAAAGQRTGRAPSTEVATTDAAGEPSLAQLVVQLKPELAHALPRHVSVDRVARIALTALKRTPALNRCTPESFLGALMTASQLGLEVNTPAGESYLIPYKNDCTLVVGYQGIVKLFWQSPQAKHIDAQAVYARDYFEYEYGLTPRLEHRPATGGDRGDVIAYYAVATLKNGGSAFVVLSPEEIKALRQGKEGPSGNIADPMRWMERKTALKQMLKLLPKTVEMTAALVADEQVRTDYTATLDEMVVTSPDGEQRTIDAVAEPVADPQTSGVACQGCGEVGVEHSPSECPGSNPPSDDEPTAADIHDRLGA